MTVPPLPPPHSLRAVTVPLDEDTVVDPFMAASPDGVVFVSPERQLAGIGVAAELLLPHGMADGGRIGALETWLRSVPVEDHVGRPGSGLLAFGALPFDRTLPGRLVVPAAVYGADGSGRWVTVVSGEHPVDPATVLRRLAPGGDRQGDGQGDGQGAADGASGANRPRAAPAGRPPDAGASPPSLRHRPTPEGYRAAVDHAVQAIARGVVEKVVLARTVWVGRPPVGGAAASLRRLHDQEPGCVAFSVPFAGALPGTGDASLFLGATPELLVRRRGRRVECHPLAGTAGLTGTADDDRVTEALVASGKDQHEHRLVVESLTALLSPWCEQLTVPGTPRLERLSSVAHLGTHLTGTLTRAAPGALGLCALLHPTPAVGGVPTAEALALIEQLENPMGGDDGGDGGPPGQGDGRTGDGGATGAGSRREPGTGRGPWAGPVGWCDGSGDGEWFIGIRSATVTAGSVRLCAGAGIVAGSDPDAELAETTVKLRPVVEALYPGGDSLVLLPLLGPTGAARALR